MGWFSILTLHMVTLSLIIIYDSLNVDGRKLFTVYWNTTNPIFRIDNTDHIIDVNKGNIPFEYDQVNIICPVYTPGTKEEEVERYIIYNVSKEEYDSCRITKPHPRIIAVCDKPHQVMYFTITFRSFTPQPGGLEFRPGQDYYFISTSDGGKDGLYHRIGGRCATHNMKVIFKVCCCPSKGTAETSTTKITTASITTTTRATIASTTTTTQVMSVSTPSWLRPLMPSNRPTISVKQYEYEVPRDVKQKSKKTEDRDKLPNETRAKNEELVTGNSTKTISCPGWTTLVILLLLTHAAR
ncbi:ephrin-B1-like isoform X2 [Centruroides vittatus]|uniref:ephrin-B1-like isoform X2 n=1 Tax=Centruroides vittatus TaxID=120091 RepID=UPI00350FFA0A